ncbi:hypothetical protein MKX03_024801, partial [Papaver bracteatum]
LLQRLQLLRIGNLILLDAMNRIKWQSFDFPANVILWGQVFNFSTSISGNSTMFYSLEIQNNKRMYLNSSILIGNSVLQKAETLYLPNWVLQD